MNVYLNHDKLINNNRSRCQPTPRTTLGRNPPSMEPENVTRRGANLGGLLPFKICQQR